MNGKCSIRRILVIAGMALFILTLARLGSADQAAKNSKGEEQVEMETGERANLLEYYARPGLMTDPGEHAELFEDLPTEISALCETVQGILIHNFWAERYGVTLSDERKEEVQIRSVAGMLARIRELDDRPLTVARPLEKRLVGNCRDFSTLLCAMLRYQGVPARARCGFGAYFLLDHYEDHWICEYWKAGEHRWVMVDAQLDQFQCEALKIQFDPLDVPPDQFLTAGKAWLMCRAGQADPDRFGIFDMHGMWFIRGNVVRDLLSLNKIEVLPWDGWGLATKEEKDVSADDMELMDHIAKLTLPGDEAFSEIRSIYENDDRLRMPSDWKPLEEDSKLLKGAEAEKVIIEGVDRYRVTDAMFEGVRIVLSYRGEDYSPAYIQSISGGAFRIAGICPCAPTCSSAMGPQALARLLGYEVEYLPLGGEGIDPEERIIEVLPRVKDEIRAGRPVVLWHAFTNAEWDVVCGFDEENRQFIGRGSYVGNEGEYATADETRTIKCVDICPPQGAILIGEKTGDFDAREAELAALREAVSHAHSVKNKDKVGGDEWVFLEGLLAYDRWISDFKNPEKIRGAGDAYCYGIYRSTHRAASDFLREIAPKYPGAAEHLQCAAKHFAAEADVLDQGADLLWWGSPEGPDPERNARAAELLSKARDSYASGIDAIDRALQAIGASSTGFQYDPTTPGR